MPLAGSGRGDPLPGAPSAKFPVFPTLSVHVPLPVTGFTTAATCTAFPLGAVTIVKLRFTWPGIFG